MKRTIAFVAVLAYAVVLAFCVATPGLLEVNFISLVLSGCVVAVIVAVATTKQRVKE
jgi:hypothetical protein